MLYNIFSKCKVNKFFFMTKCFAVKKYPLAAHFPPPDTPT